MVFRWQRRALRIAASRPGSSRWSLAGTIEDPLYVLLNSRELSGAVCSAHPYEPRAAAWGKRFGEHTYRLRSNQLKRHPTVIIRRRQPACSCGAGTAVAGRPLWTPSPSPLPGPGRSPGGARSLFCWQSGGPPSLPPALFTHMSAPCSRQCPCRAADSAALSAPRGTREEEQYDS
jgi:hypothetical protein